MPSLINPVICLSEEHLIENMAVVWQWKNGIICYSWHFGIMSRRLQNSTGASFKKVCGIGIATRDAAISHPVYSAKTRPELAVVSRK